MEEIEKGIHYSLRLLTVRPRSEKEIEERLKRKGFSSQVIPKIIDKLKEWDYLDDEKFAQAWIEERILHHPKGRIALSRELREKGISSQIIDKLLNHYLPHDKEKEIAKKLLIKKLAKEKYTPIEKKKRRVFEYLARRGFSFSLIQEILNKDLEGE